MSKQKNALKKAAGSLNTTSKRMDTISTLENALMNLVERQNVLMEKLDGFVMKVMAHEERLKRLEDSLLTHLECATWVKATIKGSIKRIVSDRWGSG